MATSARPNLSRVVRLLIRDIARRLPELAHVRAERVLVVAGEARRRSRATIRPLRFADGALRSPTGQRRKPRVRFRGREVLYVMTLRPLFFRQSTPEQRLRTVLHELLHVAPAFDGTLDPRHRHAELSPRAYARVLQPLMTRYLPLCPPALLRALASNGEVLVRHWLERPPTTLVVGSRERLRYDEEQTFLGPVRMITRRRRRSA